MEQDQQLIKQLEMQKINEDKPPEPQEPKPELLLGELMKEDRDLQTVLKTARALMDVGEPLQASELLADCIALLARRWKDRHVFRVLSVVSRLSSMTQYSRLS